MHIVCFKPLESVLFLSLGFAEFFRRMFLSVVVVTEEECEFASFFGQPSFVLFFALFLDRFFTQDIQKYVNNLQAVLDISSTNSTIATDAQVNEPLSLFSLLASKKKTVCNAPKLKGPLFLLLCDVFFQGCPYVPMFISKVVFRELSGRPSRFF